MVYVVDGSCPQCMDATLLRVAVEFKIADHLLEGPRSVEELAKICGVDKEKLSRILRSLANKHVFRAGEWPSCGNRLESPN